MSREKFEESEISHAYPGVLTVFSKEMFDAIITTKDAEVLKRIGGTDGASFSCVDGEGITRTFQWMKEEECISKNVNYRQKEEKDEDISALVDAPIDFSLDEVKSLLQAEGIDAENWIDQFAGEIAKGETALEKFQDGRLRRVVNIIELVISKESNGDVLVLTGQQKDGVYQDLNTLPAVTRREDENQFHAAVRIITDELNMDDNYVTLSPAGVLFDGIEEESKEFPGLTSFYKKLVIFATMNDIERDPT
jgi:hypothetical protein